MKKLKIYIYIFAFIVFFTGFFHVSKALAVIGENGDFLGNNVDVKITAQNFSGQANSDEFHIWGNVNIRKEDALLLADDVVFNSKTNVAVASGRVYFSQPGTEISANKVTVEYKNKQGAWDGNVTLIQKSPPNKGGEKVQEAFKDGPIKMISDSLEFSWAGPNRVVSRGRVEVHQKDKHLYGDVATYISPPETVTLDGSVRLERDDGSWLKCSTMTVDLRENKFNADGSGKSQVKVNVFYNKVK